MDRLFACTTPEHRAKEQSIFIGLALGAFGLIPGTITIVLSHSTTLMADVLKNAGLVLATFFAWMSIRKMDRGDSSNYNYGYGKLENLSSFIVATAMIIAQVFIFYHIIERFTHPEELAKMGTQLGIIFSIIAVLSSAWLWKHDHHLAQRETSPMMESLWRLYRIKTISTLLVLASLAISLAFRDHTWAAYVDPIGSIVLSGFLIFTIYSIISSSVYDLLDRTLEESLQLIILRELAAYFSEYEALHGIRSRRSGGNVHIEIFLEFDGERKMSEIQKVINSMQASLSSRINNSHIFIIPATSPVC
jgi:ferrous-iron efflux pump FieF